LDGLAITLMDTTCGPEYVLAGQTSHLLAVIRAAGSLVEMSRADGARIR
jgi:hypothetical protein